MLRLLLAALLSLAPIGTLRSELSMQNPVEVSPASSPCPQSCDRLAVIFIHGIGGDDTTWRHGDNPDWLTLLASETDPQLSGKVDVYRVKYYTPLPSFYDPAPTVPSATEISESLAAKLDNLLFDPVQGGRYKKVVLVCHSLGGILCRSHLLHVKLRWGHGYLSLFPASFSFGTPFLGSNLANLMLVQLTSNAQARAVRPEDVNDYLQLLKKSIQEFTDKRVTLGCPNLLFYAGYEEHETPLIPNEPLSPKRKIVSQQSATAGPNFEIKGFPKDHREMVKPVDSTDDAYQWVRDVLKACLSNERRCGEPVSNLCGRPPWLPLPAQR